MPDQERKEQRGLLDGQKDFHNGNKEFLDGNKEFLIEKIKEKPVNKKKLIRRTIITVSMAVIFGLVACVTFLVLEPVISNWLYPKEEPEIQTVEFPEDKEEMSPEEMLAENLPTESPEPTPAPTPEPTRNPGDGGDTYVPLGEEQVQDILSQVTFDLNHYKQLYTALHDYGNELGRSVVTVTAVTSNLDWFNSVQERSNQCSGVIIFENGMELLILTDYSAIRSAERLLLTFYDESQTGAQLKQYNEATNLAVLSVPLEELSDAVRGGPGNAQDGFEAGVQDNPTGAGAPSNQDSDAPEDENPDEPGDLGASGSPGQGNTGAQDSGGQTARNPEEPESGLPIVEFGYSNAKSLAGTPVIAVGSPMGTSNSLSYGMITASGTTVSTADRNYRILLTDISGSQNASGVLFDLQGKMIGFITNHRLGHEEPDHGLWHHGPAEDCGEDVQRGGDRLPGHPGGGCAPGGQRGAWDPLRGLCGGIRHGLPGHAGRHPAGGRDYGHRGEKRIRLYGIQQRADGSGARADSGGHSHAAGPGRI